MKKNIVILGSTGSIGRSLLNIISNDKKNFNIILLSANKNYKQLINQTKKFNVKNVIINNEKSYKKFKKYNKNKKLKIFKNFDNLNKIFKKKIDYTMSSIVGLDGLEPTFKIIKYTKKIAIANKETLICAWDLILKQMEKYQTKFVPVDSEHFSIWYALRSIDKKLIDKIYITASGGPFLNLPLKKLKKANIKQATNHPNWRMEKKISVDSATMMNKVFEIIEAKKIFNISYKKIAILVHPKSYVHAIIKLKNGLTKLVIHETNMKIPIANSLYPSSRFINSKKLDFKTLNNLNFKEIDQNRFPVTKILKFLPEKSSLFENALVLINDKLVEFFLNKKINFTDIQRILFKLINLKELKKLKLKEPKSVKEIIDLDKIVNSKISKIVYKL